MTEESKRVRFNKKEAMKLMTALENVDADELHESLRALDLEEQLADAREEARRWRKACEALSQLIEDPDFDLFDLDRKIREWVASA